VGLQKVPKILMISVFFFTFPEDLLNCSLCMPPKLKKQKQIFSKKAENY